MLGDKILFKDEHYEHADKVIDKLFPNTRRQIILIGGCSGVGKTETAIIVQRKLYKMNYSSLLISLDDYYDTFWKERDEIRKYRGVEGIGIKEIQWGALTDIIDNYKVRTTIRYRRVNKFSGHMEEIYTPSGFDFLIIEGLYALFLKEFATIFHHIEGTPKQTYEFRKERKKENPDDEWRKQIIEREYEQVAMLAKLAYELETE